MEIVIIRGITALIFFLTFLIALRVYLKIKPRKNIWLLAVGISLILTLESLANVSQWLSIYPKVVDYIGEGLLVMFFIIWICAAYKFRKRFNY